MQDEIVSVTLSQTRNITLYKCKPSRARPVEDADNSATLVLFVRFSHYAANIYNESKPENLRNASHLSR